MEAVPVQNRESGQVIVNILKELLSAPQYSRALFLNNGQEYVEVFILFDEYL